MNDKECDHDYGMVQIGLIEVEEQPDNECAWCEFDTVSVGVVKDGMDVLWLCDTCETDIEMYAMNGGFMHE